MKVYGRAEVVHHSFLTLALDGVRGQPHAPAALPLDKEPQYPLKSEWAPELV